MTKKETMDAAARGEGCLGKSQDDEPVFVLVARDKAAAETVRAWSWKARALNGGPTEKTRAAEDLAHDMDAWREAHGGGKVPD